MKLIAQGYKYFGRQCKHCGAYFTYTPMEAIDGHCPNCFCPFTHNVDDAEIDFEPDSKTLALHQKLRGKASTTVFLPTYNVGQEVYVIYDSFYSATNSSNSHLWIYDGVAKIAEIVCDASEGNEVYNYILDRPVIKGRGGQVIRDTASGAVCITDDIRTFLYGDKLTPQQKELLPVPDVQEEVDDEGEECTECVKEGVEVLTDL